MAKKITPSKRVQVKDALVEFCKDIEQTGGIEPYFEDGREGMYCPVADNDWIDLAETYRKACKALGRKPMIVGPTVKDTE
jgi:hypothetical protein